MCAVFHPFSLTWGTGGSKSTPPKGDTSCRNWTHLTQQSGKRACSDLPQLPMVHASPAILLLSRNHPMHDTAAEGDLFVILLREGRKAAEIPAQIQRCPTVASSGKALHLSWQMPGTGRSAEISVYLIFSSPFALDFSLLYVRKTPRQLISALWPLLIELCERKAAPPGEITHTCYFEPSCDFLSPCLQELQAPFCEPRLLYFHRHH